VSVDSFDFVSSDPEPVTVAVGKFEAVELCFEVALDVILKEPNRPVRRVCYLVRRRIERYAVGLGGRNQINKCLLSSI